MSSSATSVMSLPQSINDVVQWSLLTESSTPGRWSLGGDTRSFIHALWIPTTQLRSNVCRSGHDDIHNPHTDAQELPSNDKCFSWGRRSINHVSCLLEMLVQLRSNCLGCRRTIPIRWSFRIFLRFRLMKYHKRLSMHHRFHVLQTRIHLHRSVCGKYLKTNIQIWWSRTWLAPLSIMTCLGGGGIGAGRTTYFCIGFMRTLQCFRGAFVWYSAISLRFLGTLILLVSSSLPPSLSFLSLVGLFLESRELMEPPSESGLWQRWPGRNPFLSSPSYNINVIIYSWNHMSYQD